MNEYTLKDLERAGQFTMAHDTAVEAVLHVLDGMSQRATENRYNLRPGQLQLVLNGRRLPGAYVEAVALYTRYRREQREEMQCLPTGPSPSSPTAPG